MIKKQFKNMIFGDESSPIALCTFWTNIKCFKKYKNNFYLIGNLFSAKGIHYMLYNLAHSNISCVIFIGNDLNKLKPILEDVRILPEFDMYEEIVKNVKFVFTKEKYLLDTLEDIQADIEPKEIQKANEPFTSTYKSKMPKSIRPGILIYDKDPENAWKKIVQEILTLGCQCGDTMEIQNVVAVTNAKMIDGIDPMYTTELLMDKNCMKEDILR